MTYRIFGSELSPYSVKVRSFFRYKCIGHEWIPRSPAVQAEFQKYARLPLVPLVVTPEGEGIQDSTPILERFESSSPQPSVIPDDPALAFVSALLEEYGDEWGNKWFSHS
jgi:glutathione S-transferase